MSILTEDTVEQAALEWLSEIGFEVIHGPDIAPGEDASERDSFGDVVLEQRLKDAIARLNPVLPADAQEEALRKVIRPDLPSLIQNNRTFHRRLRDGVEIEYRKPDGTISGDHVQLMDFDDPHSNDFVAVNQFTIIEAGKNRRPDVLLFVNGLPLVVIELKNQADEDATIDKAYQQIQTYKDELPSLFQFNEIVVISDGPVARIGSLTAGFEWYKPWRTIEDETPVTGKSELEILIRGAFDPSRMLELIRGFILFEDDPDSDQVHKILAGYHQFHAARRAIAATVEATRPEGDRRCGVVWHTQGSGKSFTMLFYSGQVIINSEMNNPTLVVLTDRNDLDDQLFGQFQRCSEILRQKPIQAESVEHLRELLQVASGGVIFTTVHKFSEDEGEFPLLTDRKNVVVMADEAHRSQYGFTAKQDKETGKVSYGFARNIRDGLPNASFIGFTGTPIELRDANTRAVFGDYVSVYDIQRAVEDKATVPIYYENRVIKMELAEKPLETLDEDFETVTEELELSKRERLKSKWAALEAMVGDDDRLRILAKDLVEHFETRQEAMDGKGMIVCMSRRICIDLYNEIIKLRPEWHSEDDQQGFVKIIMTGSASDGAEWQQHIRTKERRKKLASHFKDSKSPFKLVIVRDMWLTGFDAPSMHTMYLDKPMKGHGLMQAIARVNRVFKEKPGGLVVDYLGIGDSLKAALKTYTESGGSGETTIDTADAVAALQKQYEVCCDMLHGVEWSGWASATPAQRMTLPVVAQEHILKEKDGRELWLAHVSSLSQAFALCPTEPYATEIRDDVAFFQVIATMLRKYTESGKSKSELDYAVRQLVSKTVVTAEDGVIDVFTAAGMKKPDISVLSEQFLDEVRRLPHKNVAVQLLKKLLNDEIKVRKARNVVQAKSFSDMLQKTLNSYHNRAIETHEIIEELIKLSKELQEAGLRAGQLGLNDDEVAFYDALAQNESAMDAMGDDQLKVIAAELVQQVRKNVSIDWTLRESARARIRVMVRRILNKHGYPPDLRAEATKLVLEQAAVLCEGWV
jgi:type I restriction enzyme R subunit